MASSQKPLSMNVGTASFVKSSAVVKECPPPEYPEYAFIGRSNVGKSSLINSLVNQKGLAKTSSTPGKTQLINHFIINEKSDPWYIVDLPGYGFAKAPKKERHKWADFIREYFLFRESLMGAVVLIDARHTPQRIDLEFMEWLGENDIPFIIAFTKFDKLSSAQRNKNMANYQKEMLKTWTEMPMCFYTSAETGFGKSELLNFIGETNQFFGED